MFRLFLCHTAFQAAGLQIDSSGHSTSLREPKVDNTATAMLKEGNPVPDQCYGFQHEFAENSCWPTSVGESCEMICPGSSLMHKKF